jgi:hypothetical protein
MLVGAIFRPSWLSWLVFELVHAELLVSAQRAAALEIVHHGAIEFCRIKPKRRHSADEQIR